MFLEESFCFIWFKWPKMAKYHSELPQPWQLVELSMWPTPGQRRWIHRTFVETIDLILTSQKSAMLLMDWKETPVSDGVCKKSSDITLV